MTVTKSEIFKAAHRQARRMEYVGGPSYAERFATALRDMIAFSRKPVKVGGYAGLSCVTIKRAA